jgi:hypothetical protein
MLVNRDSSTGRRFLAMREDLGPQVKDVEAVGEGPFFAASRWASADPEDVRLLIKEIEDGSAQTGQRISVGMARKDVPEENLRNYWAQNQVGSHDYEINLGESLTSTPIDLNGRLITGPGGELSNGISYEEALRDHADALNQAFDQLFTHEGRVLHELTVPGAARKGVDPAWIFDGGTPIPSRVLGPELYIPSESSLEKFTRVGFDKMITPLTNAVSRHPLFIHNALRRVDLAEGTLRPMLTNVEAREIAEGIASKLGMKNVDELYALKQRLPSSLKDVEAEVRAGRAPSGLLHLGDEEWKGLHDFMRNEEHIRKAVGDTAMHGALGDTIPYIDDHKVRSQFSDEIRNFVPFWWAQEAFFRRWAKTLVHSPEAIVKAQLIMQGARHVGAIYKDEDGNDTFMVPGTNELWSVLNRGAHLVLGDKAPILPVPLAITGKVRLATPGFDAIGVPGYGPLVGIPLGFLRERFPELSSIEDGLLGERGSGRSWVEQLLPSFVVKVYKAYTANRDTDAQLASATIQAMQYLEANGHGLPEDATARQQQDYIDRAAHWAKNVLVFRALFGFADPAPADLEIGDVEIRKEYIDLFKNLPIEEAISELVKRHPDATPYTIFGTKSVSGATLPATQASKDFLENNRKFVEKYKLGSSWMLPQAQSGDENLRSVYALQQELGLRDSKTPEEWYTDFKFGQSADVYFKSRDNYEIARAKLKSPHDRAIADENWTKWKEGYFERHPVFADEIQTRSGVQRREHTIEELHKAFRDPDLPDFEHKTELKTMLDSYDVFQNAMRKLKGKRGTDASKDRDTIRTNFYTWARGYTNEHPSVLFFYQRVIDPDIGLDVVDRQRLGE